MKPTIGRIVHYKLSDQDAQAINRRRTSGAAIAERIAAGTWPIGAQAHVGPPAVEGTTVPLIVVAADDTMVNGRAFLDGSEELAVSRAAESQDPHKPGTWRWPPRE